MSRLLKEKLAKIVVYNARVTGRTNYDYPGQPWVPKLVNNKKKNRKPKCQTLVPSFRAGKVQTYFKPFVNDRSFKNKFSGCRSFFTLELNIIFGNSIFRSFSKFPFVNDLNFFKRC